MSTRHPPDLEPDCQHCASLCCVVFAFDNSEYFAFDKAAGEVCRNLGNDGRCQIFDKREKLGFKGCIAYNCHGAGQRVTQEVFGGRSWRDDPTLKQPMEQALSVLRRIHELLLLLRTARQLPLSRTERSQIDLLENRLEPATAWTEDSLRRFNLIEASKSVQSCLQGLRHHMEN